MRSASVNNFTSPVFLGTTFPNYSPVPFPDIYDADLWAWYDATQWVVRNTALNTIYTLGNAAAYQVNKTARTSPANTNLVPYLFEPFTTTTTPNVGNLMNSSEIFDTNYWGFSGCTRNSNTTATFTTQNGLIYQYPINEVLEAGSATLSVRARAISGNTALQLKGHTTYSDITLTASMATYTMTFTAPAASTPVSSFSCGIRDPNAAGFGQIETDTWSLRKTSWDNTHVVVTGNNGAIPPVTPLNTTAFFLGNGRALKHANATGLGFTTPFTLYMTLRPMWKASGFVLTLSGGGLSDWYFATGGSAGQYSVYTSSGNRTLGTPAGWLTDHQWVVITVVTNGASSILRKNLDTPITGTLGSIPANTAFYGWGFWPYTGDPGPHYSTDLIIRRGADSSLKQEAYVRYLANKVGVAV